MITLNAKKRETKTSGDINRLRLDKFIPGILYGGSEENKKISLSKNLIKNLIKNKGVKIKDVYLYLPGFWFLFFLRLKLSYQILF